MCISVCCFVNEVFQAFSIRDSMQRACLWNAYQLTWQLANLHHCDWSLFPADPVNVQRCCSTLFSTEPFYVKLRWLYVHLYWWVYFISEYNQGKNQIWSASGRVNNGQSGENLHTGLLCLGNIKTSDRLVWSLTRVPSTTTVDWHNL